MKPQETNLQCDKPCEVRSLFAEATWCQLTRKKRFHLNRDPRNSGFFDVSRFSEAPTEAFLPPEQRSVFGLAAQGLRHGWMARLGAHIGLGEMEVSFFGCLMWVTTMFIHSVAPKRPMHSGLLHVLRLVFLLLRKKLRLRTLLSFSSIAIIASWERTQSGIYPNSAA